MTVMLAYAALAFFGGYEYQRMIDCPTCRSILSMARRM